MTRVIISTLALVLSGAIFFFYTQSTYDNTQAIRTQINEYNVALEKSAQLLQLKQQLLSRYNLFNPQDIERIQKMLPDHVDNIRLILDMDSMAAAYGMTLSNVDISGSMIKGQNQQTVATIGSNNKKHDMLTIKFNVDSTYDNFKKFLTDLQSSLRIVDLVSLSIQPGSGVRTSPSGAATEPVYHFSIGLRTYWLK